VISLRLGDRIRVSLILLLACVVLVCLSATCLAADDENESSADEFWRLYQISGDCNPAWDQYVHEGINLAYDSRRQSALDQFDKAFEQGCHCPVVHALAAKIAASLRLGMPIVEFHAREALRLSEYRGGLTYSRQQAYYALGSAHRTAGELDEALEDLQSGLALDPNSDVWSPRLKKLIESVEHRVDAATRSEVLAARLQEAPGTGLQEAALVDETVKLVDELREENEFFRAESLCRAALEQRPGHLELMKAEQLVFCELRRFHEAEELDVRIVAAAEASGDPTAFSKALFNQFETFWVDYSYNMSARNYERICKQDLVGIEERLMALSDKTGDREIRYLGMYAGALREWKFGDKQNIVSWQALERFKELDRFCEQEGWEDRANNAKAFAASFLAGVRRLEESEEYSRKAGLPVNLTVLIWRKDWQAIYDRFKNNADVMEVRISSMPTERLKRNALPQNRIGPEIFMVACLELGKTAEAIETLERLNNLTLGNILTSRALEARQKAFAERMEGRDQAEDRVERLTAQLAKARTGADQEETHSIQRDLTLQSQALAQIRTDLRVDELEIRDATGRKPMDVAEMQSLLDDDTAIIMYGTGWSGWSGYGIIGVVTADSVHAVLEPSLNKMRSVDNDFGERFYPFLSLINSPNADAEAMRKMHYLARSLHEHLLQPVNDYIADKKRLIFVPSGPLARVPFHLLRDRNGRSVLEEHVVSYAQSVGVMKRCLERGKKAGGAVWVVADPAAPAAPERLKFAGTEASAIRGVFPTASILAGDRATETAVKGLLPASDVLHFACHSFLNAESAMSSALVLAPDDQNDGMLTAREICDYPVTAGLIVLSVCESGGGELSGAWTELVGMSRAWLLAGAPSTMLTLWRIDDRATSELMSEFYRNLATLPKAEALRRAQMTMMDRYENPYYWGAFVLYGDYR
jgi:CHAT domain-containing protein